MIDDGFPTISSVDQDAVESAVYEALKDIDDVKLWRSEHISFLETGLRKLPKSFQSLDASRPWLVFWISQALDVLGAFDENKLDIASFLALCQNVSGGFGGGPMQLPHLATTYAAVCGIIISGDYSVVDRQSLYCFIKSLKSDSGGFRMHQNGETDMRGTYCAMAVGSLLGILTDELTDGVTEYILSCQTFEGGFAGDSGGLEAHGGYSYCGLAALGILRSKLGTEFFIDKKDRFQKLLWWVCQRQMTFEGGFNGRANKLVDSCYSFWQGASLVILRDIFEFCGWQVPNEPGNMYWFSRAGLETYVLGACQNCNGGCKDKPGKNADYYHTCYSLSGLAVTLEEEQDAHGILRTDALYNLRPSRIDSLKNWLASHT